MARTPREGIDFFPLSVEYEARLYAAGRIPGSFFRREGRPSESAILVYRLTDRPLRPLFPEDFRNDVQVVITSLSADQEHQIDVLAINGASAALTISDIPFQGPIAGVRVGYIDGQFVVNPTLTELDNMGHADGAPKLTGRNIYVMLTPLPVNKRKLKFHVREGPAQPAAAVPPPVSPSPA